MRANIDEAQRSRSQQRILDGSIQDDFKLFALRGFPVMGPAEAFEGRWNLKYTPIYLPQKTKVSMFSLTLQGTISQSKALFLRCP